MKNSDFSPNVLNERGVHSVIFLLITGVALTSITIERLTDSLGCRGKEWINENYEYFLMPEIHTSSCQRGELFCILSWEWKVKLKVLDIKNAVNQFIFSTISSLFKSHQNVGNKISRSLSLVYKFPIFLRCRHWQLCDMCLYVMNKEQQVCASIWLRVGLSHAHKLVQSRWLRGGVAVLICAFKLAVKNQKIAFYFWFTAFFLLSLLPPSIHSLPRLTNTALSLCLAS